jgi:peptide/nickel transport system substrate-binding protein
VSPDGLTYTFHLVRNATWSDDVNFTSADVKYTFETLLPTYQSTGKVYFGMITNVDTPDDYTAIFHLNQTNPGLLEFLDVYQGPVMPKHIYEGTAVLTNPQNTNRTVVIGPFKMKEWIKGDHLTFVRNDKYYRKPLPYLDEVIFKIIPDDTARVIALKNGEIDAVTWYPVIPFSQLQSLQTTSGIGTAIIFGAQARNCDLHLNMREHTPLWPEGGPVNPFSNVEVRHAVSMAMNRSELVEKVYYGFSKVTENMIPEVPTTDWYRLNDSRYLLTYNVTAANAILDKYYPQKDSDGIRRIETGKRFTIHTVSTTDTLQKEIMEIVRDNLRVVGIEAIPEAYEYMSAINVYFTTLNFDIMFHSGHWNGPDPKQLESLWAPWRILPGVAWSNNMGWNNSRVGELFILGASTVNRTQRAEYFYELQRLAFDDMPTVPLTLYPLPIAWNEKVHNYNTEVGTFEGQWLDEVWIGAAVEPTQEANFPWMEVATGVGVAVIVTLVAVALYMRRKPRKPKTS